MREPPAPRPLKFAAIDVGSNAVRLLLSRVITDDGRVVFKKESLVRIPLRLGEDVFTRRDISPEKRISLTSTLLGFRHLMAAYGAHDYLACATCAMREAENGTELVAEVRAASGVELEVIDGSREAELICLSRPEGWLQEDQAYLFIDVGGGSTEITLFANLRRVEANSFDVGGIRILKGGVPPGRWDQMRRWVREATGSYRPVTAIGSGGNINKIFRLARQKEGTAITYKRFRRIFNYLRGFTLEERIGTLGLKPDRADVIIPASEIYLSVMKWAKSKAMLVPMVGLSDGLVRVLYDRYRGRTAGSGTSGGVDVSSDPSEPATGMAGSKP
jgi:exopolyphosphatase/guanosine-5'-triphosphate,3'-diphosphate pyrophosphatase